MKFLRHVGTLRNSGHRVVVVFRKLDDEPNSCLVVESDALPDRYHQNLMEALESVTAQETLEFFEYANRQFFYDGSNMLATLHTKGWLRKVSTDTVIMRPRTDLEINLATLNISLDNIGAGIESDQDQATPSEYSALANASVKTDKDLAQDLINQALLFEKQASDLRAQAAALVPEASIAKLPKARVGVHTSKVAKVKKTSVAN